MKVVWSPECVRAIGDHVAFISKDSSKNATKWANDLFVRVEGILEFPLLGRVSKHQGARDIREIVIDARFILTYRVKKTEIRILAFFHTAQDR